MRDMDLGFDLLAGEQAIAIRQARRQVAIDAGAIAVIVTVWMLVGFPRHLAWTVGIVVSGAITTIADLRWWLWLRHATPADAYDRLQSRSDDDGAAARPWLTRILTIGLFAIWWQLAR